MTVTRKRREKIYYLPIAGQDGEAGLCSGTEGTGKKYEGNDNF